jgi:hypothetical protein
MKKIIIGSTFILMVIVVPLHAQFKQGTIMAGGSVSGTFTTDKLKYGNTTTTNDTHDVVSLLPEAGYFVIDNLAFGLGLLYSSDVMNYKGPVEKTTQINKIIAPFARYYYHKFFAQSSYRTGWGTIKDSYGGVTTTTKIPNVNGWSAGIGYAYLLSEHIAVEPSIGYGDMYSKFLGSSTKTSQPIFFIQIGFQIYLHK